MYNNLKSLSYKPNIIKWTLLGIYQNIRKKNNNDAIDVENIRIVENVYIKNTIKDTIEYVNETD